MQKIGLKHVLVLSVAAALCVPTSAAAMDVDFSGQINQLVMYANDGDKSDVMIGDNDNSSSRVAAKVKEKFDNITVGGTVEIEGQVNATNNMEIYKVNDDGDWEWKARKVEGYFQGGFGKVSLGQGDGAANGTSEVDLSGTTVIMYSDINTTAKSMSFKSSDGTKITTVGSTRDNYDGLSRNQRVRYDTPSFAGFSVAASMTNGSAYELAARYAADVMGRLEAAVGYVDTQNRGDRSDDEADKDDYTQIGGSVSWLLPFGLNFTASVAQRNNGDNGKEDSMSWYGKVGYKSGIHAIAVEYGATMDKQQKDDTSTNIGVAYVVKPWKQVELYAAGRQYSLDRNGVDTDAIMQIMAGTRIKF